MAHIRQPRPDSGLGFQVAVVTSVKVVPSSLVGFLAVYSVRHGPTLSVSVSSRRACALKKKPF